MEFTVASREPIPALPADAERRRGKEGEIMEHKIIGMIPLDKLEMSRPGKVMDRKYYFALAAEHGFDNVIGFAESSCQIIAFAEKDEKVYVVQKDLELRPFSPECEHCVYVVGVNCSHEDGKVRIRVAAQKG